MDVASDHCCDQLTWEEINGAIASQQLVPRGSIEQQGSHLLVNLHVFLAEFIYLELGHRVSDRRLLLPVVAYGRNRHYIDFPRRTPISPGVFIVFCLGFISGMAYHGFEKLWMVNRDGSTFFLTELIDAGCAWRIGSRSGEHSNPVEW